MFNCVQTRVVDFDRNRLHTFSHSGFCERASALGVLYSNINLGYNDLQYATECKIHLFLLLSR